MLAAKHGGLGWDGKLGKRRQRHGTASASNGIPYGHVPPMTGHDDLDRERRRAQRYPQQQHHTEQQNENKMAKSIQNEQTTLHFPACFHSCFRTLASRHSSSSTPTMKALHRHGQSRSSIISRRHAAGQLRPTCHPFPASYDITYIPNVSAFSHFAPRSSAHVGAT